MALHGRLNTAVRISKWNDSVDIKCRICSNFYDSQAHLFGQCLYAKDIWTFIFKFLDRPIRFAGFKDQISIMQRMVSKKTPLDKTIVMIWTEFIYEVWHQRNSKTFKGLIDPPVRAARSIMFRVACRDHNDYAVL